jgi:hypothetical protein
MELIAMDTECHQVDNCNSHLLLIIPALCHLDDGHDRAKLGNASTDSKICRNSNAMRMSRFV